MLKCVAIVVSSASPFFGVSRAAKLNLLGGSFLGCAQKQNLERVGRGPYRPYFKLPRPETPVNLPLTNPSEIAWECGHSGALCDHYLKIIRYWKRVLQIINLFTSERFTSRDPFPQSCPNRPKIKGVNWSEGMMFAFQSVVGNSKSRLGTLFFGFRNESLKNSSLCYQIR